jgi:superfamily II DNA or RNA helicase
MSNWSVILTSRAKIFGSPDVIAFCREQSSFVYEVSQQNHQTKRIEKVKKRINVFREEQDKGLLVPLGVYYLVKDKFGKPDQVIDKRSCQQIQSVTMSEDFSLRAYQEAVAAKILEYESIVLVGKAGSGKTLIAAYLIAERQAKTLFVVPTKDLMEQTFQKFNHNMVNVVIGRLGGQYKEIGSDILIAVIDSAVNQIEELKKENFSMVILDEAHKEVNNVATIMNNLNPKYRLAMTATPYRYDKLEQYLYLLFGKYLIPMSNPDTKLPEIKAINTHVAPTEKDPTKSTAFVNSLYYHADRYQLIIDLIKKCKDKKTLVVCSRKDVVDALNYDLEHSHGIGSYRLHSGVPDRGVVTDFAHDEGHNVLISIDKICDTGLDIPRLDIVINTVIFKDEAKAVQLIGRLNRGINKKYFFDLVDDHPYCVNLYKQRRKAYEKSLDTLS